MAAYGYARVSTLDQDLTVQQQALQAAGCGVIRAETASGSKRDGRTELQMPSMEAPNVSMCAALEAVNPSRMRRMEASTATDNVEHLHLAYTTSRVPPRARAATSGLLPA